jgi:hypothetical protein
MIHRESILELLGLPSEFGYLLLVLGLIFVLAPYVADHDFSIIKIPNFATRIKRVLKVFGPICFLIVLSMHIRFYGADHELSKTRELPELDVSPYNPPAVVLKPQEPQAGIQPGKPPAVPQSSRSAEGVTQSEVVEASVAWGSSEMAEADVPLERVITYQSHWESGISHIMYRLPYLELVERGELVSGVNYLGSPFKWRFPELSIKLVNNTERTHVLSRALLEIVSSEVFDKPVLLVEDLSVNQLVFRNEGWGEVVNPEVWFTVSESLKGDEVPLFVENEHHHSLNNFPESASLPIEPYLPRRLRDASVVSVQGRLDYGQAEERRSLNFRTRVSLQVRAAVGIPPSREYDAFFKAGESGQTFEIGLAQEIRPGDSDHFLIRLGSDRSSRSRIRIRFQTAGGKVLPGSEILIDLFVPRSTGKLVSSKR